MPRGASGGYNVAMTRSLLLALPLLVLSVHVGGCAALPAATLGPLLGVVSSAVSTGSEIYQPGKLDMAEMAAFEERSTRQGRPPRTCACDRR